MELSSQCSMAVRVPYIMFDDAVIMVIEMRHLTCGQIVKSVEYG